jgi:hypothetical protein
MERPGSPFRRTELENASTVKQARPARRSTVAEAVPDVARVLGRGSRREDHGPQTIKYDPFSEPYLLRFGS